ncbi:MAG: thioredoxin domain-containing protein [Polyangiaceae bacterium]|nr:thioredoxin domain-containing protein [Polyangiaceae bacterium]
MIADRLKLLLSGSATVEAGMETTNQAQEEAGSPSGCAPVTEAPIATLWLALLCLLGVAVSVELTRIHVFAHTDPNYQSVCALNEGVNCETVAVSPHSVFGGLPVSVWGIVGYLAMGILALWGRSTKRLHAAWPLGLLLLLTAFAAAVSAVLAFISATRIDSLCVFCVSSYAINAALLTVTLLAVRRCRVRGWQLVALDLGALVKRPALSVGLALLGAAALGLLWAWVPSYWRVPGWTDLPNLASGSTNEGHHWIGARSPTLTIVEFSDYECPHCRAAHKAVRMLASKHPDEIRLVHRHLPLDMACHPGLRRPFHRRACWFAEAAECAGLQGRFWEMNDALFATQETTRSIDVDPEALAVRLGLDRSEFKRCLANRATTERVRRDLDDAIAKHLSGTPSFLIGEQLFLGRIPEARLERLLAEGGVKASSLAEQRRPGQS